MKLSNVPDLRVEDFGQVPANSGLPDFMNKLFFQLNPFFQSLSDTFNENIDFSDNILAVSKSYSNITSFQPFNISWPSSTNPVDCRVVSALNGTTATILLAAWSYNASKQQITISNLMEVTTTGVSALSGTYSYTVRATV